jgi:hypothetical protein
MMEATAMTPCHHENPEDRRCLVIQGNDISWCWNCGGVVHIRPHLNQPILDVEEARDAIRKLMCDTGRWAYTQLENHDLYGDIPASHPAFVTMDAAGVEYNRFAEEQGVISHWDNVDIEVKREFRLKVINQKWKMMREGPSSGGTIEIPSEVD